MIRKLLGKATDTRSFLPASERETRFAKPWMTVERMTSRFLHSLMCQWMLVVFGGLLLRAVKFETDWGFDLRIAKAADDRSRL